MNTNNKTQVFKDLPNKSILISREFNAPLKNVWRAYTESELLEQWWAPKPWRAETKSMNFTVGGYWLYAMVGPDNSKHWGRANYLAINPLVNFEVEDAFCDEEGNMNTELPVTKWNIIFTESNTGTKIEVKLIFGTEADLQKLVEMGFEQGFSIGLNQLEELLNQSVL
jgi:uncharacterized protein YndB with AHSA1/START domain